MCGGLRIPFRSGFISYLHGGQMVHLTGIYPLVTGIRAGIICLSDESFECFVLLIGSHAGIVAADHIDSLDTSCHNSVKNHDVGSMPGNHGSHVSRSFRRQTKQCGLLFLLCSILKFQSRISSNLMRRFHMMHSPLHQNKSIDGHSLFKGYGNPCSAGLFQRLHVGHIRAVVDRECTVAAPSVHIGPEPVLIGFNSPRTLSLHRHGDRSFRSSQYDLTHADSRRIRIGDDHILGAG